MFFQDMCFAGLRLQRFVLLLNVLCCAAWLAAGWRTAARGERLGLPPDVHNDQNPQDRTITPQESLGRIEVPAGFHVTLFAGEPHVSQPIAADFDDRGRLWVVECFSHPVWEPTGQDRILIFEDTNADGRFDKRSVFFDEGNYLTGLLYGHGGVWICNTPNLMFIPDRNRDDIPDGPPQIHLDGWSRENPHNVLNNLTWGPDGWLYGCIGNNAASLVGKPGTPPAERNEIQRGIWRYHPIDHTFEVVGRGAVNPWGLDFNDWGEGFFTNCVLGHLWHLVPGAYYQRRDLEKDNPLAYSRVAPISDHLHWGGGRWQDSRGGQHVHDRAGGGHAHTGAMVYLGDNFPTHYRNTFFTGNLHGNRINNDRLERLGASYVGRHSPDFLYGNHEWFRCLWQKYGPDGSAFVGDWHDYGECHDNDGSHRTSGRIYRIRYGNSPGQSTSDLTELDNEELVDLQHHPNDWYVRHARRLLQERARAGDDLSEAHRQLRQNFHAETAVTRQLRSLWALYVIGAADESFLLEQLDHPQEYVRAWVVRLLCDRGVPTSQVAKLLASMASTERSPLVRLYLASAMQRFPAQQRWELAGALAGQASDAADHTLPHMLWYGIAPLVAANPERAMQLLVQAEIPLLRQHIARCAATAGHLGKVHDPAAQLDVLRGLRQALQGVKNPTVPKGWDALFARASASSNPDLQREAMLVALWLGDEQAELTLRQELHNPAAELRQREETLDALVHGRADDLAVDLLRLLDDPQLRRPALRGLAAFDDASIGQVVLDRFADFSSGERQDAIGLLTSRPALASQLLDAVERGVIGPREVSAYAARQMASLGDATVDKRLRETWGEVRTTHSQRRQRIAELKVQLTPEFLGKANVRHGRQIYETTCSKCHRLFGNGGTIGPDITGAQRNNLDYVLENVLDPSAVVASDYQLWTVVTVDGRVVSGTILERDPSRVILQTIDQQVAISTDDIDQIEPSTVSMMPAGQIDRLPIEAIRDLVAYLALPTQVPLPEESQ